ncbi:MAG: hypothetical protein AB7T63_10365 [Planctomycetota bacterium]
MAVRRRAEVVGPGPPGRLLVRILIPGVEPGEQDYMVPVPVEAMPPAVRIPGARPVVVVRGRAVVGVEEAGAGERWLLVQDRVRRVLNELWDPIGVADVVLDEYDDYIEELLGLCAAGTDAGALARHLDGIVSGRMGLVPSHTASADAANALVKLGLLPLP